MIGLLREGLYFDPSLSRGYTVPKYRNSGETRLSALICDILEDVSGQLSCVFAAWYRGVLIVFSRCKLVAVYVPD